MQRERVVRTVRRGKYLVEVPLDAVMLPEYPGEPHFDRAAVRLLDEVAERAEKGDLPYLRSVGKVYELVEA